MDHPCNTRRRKVCHGIFGHSSKVQGIRVFRKSSSRYLHHKVAVQEAAARVALRAQRGQIHRQDILDAELVYQNAFAISEGLNNQIIAGVVILHIWALHIPGSNNPTGVDVKTKSDTLPFHPYFTIKDGFADSDTLSEKLANEIADRIAQNLGIEKASPRRAEAGVIHTLGEATDDPDGGLGGVLGGEAERLLAEVDLLLADVVVILASIDFVLGDCDR